MCSSIPLILLISIVRQVRVEEVGPNHIADAQASVDKLVDNLIDKLLQRTLMASPSSRVVHGFSAFPWVGYRSLLSRRATQVRKLASAAMVGEAFEQKREAVKNCLAREYKSFFRPFEEEFYSEDVTFKDPLNSLSGKASYKGNVEMLSGDSFVGNILFSDGFIDLHAVEDVPEDRTRLRTRWTLGFVFKLLPWKPKALFSGISEYTIDPSSALVLTQRDYWDTLSLQAGGSYLPETASEGVLDLVGQLLPDSLKPLDAQEPAAASGIVGWKLLRRARAYRVYRADDGIVFAIPAPGKELLGVEQGLKLHGLVPGQRVQVKGTEAVEVQPPHPWDCDPP